MCYRASVKVKVKVHYSDVSAVQIPTDRLCIFSTTELIILSFLQALLDVFNQTKTEFLMSGFPAEEVFMFHGTKDANIDSILINNFSLTRCAGQAYGNGIYFSEFPTVGLGYGTLILCRVLVGRVEVKQRGFYPSFTQVQWGAEYRSNLVCEYSGDQNIDHLNSQFFEIQLFEYSGDLKSDHLKSGNT